MHRAFVLPLFLLQGVVSALPNPIQPPTSTITPAPLYPRQDASNFVGWSSYSASGNLTRYASQYCGVGLSYTTSVLSGTTYGQCCTIGSNCASSTFAMSCVSNNELAGTAILRNCGTLTCNSAVIYQTYGATDNSIEWHGCMSNAKGGIYYRTMPSNALPSSTTSRTTSATSTASTKKSASNSGSTALIVVFVIIGVVLGCLWFFIPLCTCLRRSYKQVQVKAVHDASAAIKTKKQRRPALVTEPYPRSEPQDAVPLIDARTFSSPSTPEPAAARGSEERNSRYDPLSSRGSPRPYS